jgi:hypothetical protein
MNIDSCWQLTYVLMWVFRVYLLAGGSMSTHSGTHTPFFCIHCIHKIECVGTEVMPCADFSPTKYSRTFKNICPVLTELKWKSLRKSALVLEGRNEPSLLKNLNANTWRKVLDRRTKPWNTIMWVLVGRTQILKISGEYDQRVLKRSKYSWVLVTFSSVSILRVLMPEYLH